MTDTTHHQTSFKSAYATAALFAVPNLGFAVYMLQATIEWNGILWMLCGIAALAAFNFLTMILSDAQNIKTGPLTPHILLGMVGLGVIVLCAEAVNRFLSHIGYVWMLPFVSLYLLLAVVAMFKETRLSLQCLMGLDMAAIAMLWNLAHAEKLAIPF